MNGRWLIARTLRGAPYPCRCQPGRGCTNRCPCRGRRDTDKVPTHCCAYRTTRTAPTSTEETRPR